MSNNTRIIKLALRFVEANNIIIVYNTIPFARENSAIAC